MLVFPPDVGKLYDVYAEEAKSKKYQRVKKSLYGECG